MPVHASVLPQNRGGTRWTGVEHLHEARGPGHTKHDSNRAAELRRASMLMILLEASRFADSARLREVYGESVPAARSGAGGIW